MPRLLKFRPLCDGCERAEASVWCLGERTALCKPCDTKKHAPRHGQRHRRVPIAASSVVSALCARCASAPAATFLLDHSLALCELCARDIPPHAAPRPPPGVVPLRDSSVAGSIVFDKMDFSTLLEPKAAWRGHPRSSSGAGTTADSSRATGSASSSASAGATKGKKRSSAVAASDPAPGKMWRWLGAQNEAHSRTDCTPQIDLSYFKTEVPPSVARGGPKKGSRVAVKGNVNTLARVSGGRAAKANSGGRKEKK